MHWWSETAVLWLPVASRPASGDFANRAQPGTDNFYYYALDAFDAIARQRSEEFDREPWAYVLADQQILSPGEIDQMMDEWNGQMNAVGSSEMVTAGKSMASGGQP